VGTKKNEKGGACGEGKSLMTNEKKWSPKEKGHVRKESGKTRKGAGHNRESEERRGNFNGWGDLLWKKWKKNYSKKRKRK